jgi:ribosomal protein S18 acetylase RimI-like enzyme
MQIQDVQPEDTEALDALMRHVVTTSITLESDEMAEVLGNIQKNLHWAQQNASSVVHLKCVDDTGIVGVVLIKNFWNLCSLFVDPGVQRQGIGRALLTEAIRRSLALNDRGHVRVNSAPNAVQFYRSLGFSIIDGQPHRGTSLPMLLNLSS